MYFKNIEEEVENLKRTADLFRDCKGMTDEEIVEVMHQQLKLAGRFWGITTEQMIHMVRLTEGNSHDSR